MLDGAKVLGQPVNPLLTVLPLGILGSAVLVDFGAMVSGSRLFGTVAQADLLVGLLVGVVSLSAILIDLLTAPTGSIARQVLTVVAALTAAMIAIFTVIWSVRADGHGLANGGVFVLELVALAAGVLGAHLARRVAIGEGLPPRYRAVSALAGHYLAEAGTLTGRYLAGLGIATGRYLAESGAVAGRFLAQRFAGARHHLAPATTAVRRYWASAAIAARRYWARAQARVADARRRPNSD